MLLNFKKYIQYNKVKYVEETVKAWLIQGVFKRPCQLNTKSTAYSFYGLLPFISSLTLLWMCQMNLMFIHKVNDSFGQRFIASSLDTSPSCWPKHPINKIIHFVNASSTLPNGHSCISCAKMILKFIKQFESNLIIKANNLLRRWQLGCQISLQ